MNTLEKKKMANEIIDVISFYDPVDAMDVLIDVLAAVIVTSKKDDLNLSDLAKTASRDLLHSMQRMDGIWKNLN